MATMTTEVVAVVMIMGIRITATPAVAEIEYYIFTIQTSLYSSSPSVLNITYYFSTNFEAYSHFVAFFKIFCFSNTRFNGHNVAAIFRP